MTYPVLADFRTATLAEYCQDIPLTITEAPDALLTAAIARMVGRLEAHTNDSFVQATPVTYELRGDGTSRLDLPQRCTAITTVKTRDWSGVLTTQDTATYRLSSSLDAAGAKRVTLDAMDYLQVVVGRYLVLPWGVGNKWPQGPNTVQVVGTFGWTVTPPDINRAIALMTFDAVRAQAQNLRRATRLETADAVYTYDSEDTDHPTGVNEADDIIRNYRRSSGLLVG